ncbi:uncharacterized protein LOC107364066 isoform X2 [Tetranychus urticae]|nr:uncharacterized protein LOC107364066 isoform X2 [Tetranychus urticae]
MNIFIKFNVQLVKMLTDFPFNWLAGLKDDLIAKGVNYLERNTSTEQLVDHLIKMNDLGKFWLVCIRGYSQKGIIPVKKRLISTGLDALCITVLGYIIFLALTADTRKQSVQIATSIFILINLLGIRWASIYCEYIDQYTILRFFDDIIRTGSFDIHCLLGSTNCNLFKWFTFILLQFYSLSTIISGIALILYHIFAVLRVDLKLGWTLLTDVTILITVPSVAFVIIFVVHNVTWCFTHIIILMIHSAFALDNIHKKAIKSMTTSKCNADPTQADSNDCAEYWHSSNFCYNQIKIMKYQLSPITFYGYLLGCLGTDFALFTGAIYGTGDSTLNYIITGLGLLALQILTMVNEASAFALRIISKCEKLNYRMSCCCKCQTTIKLKGLLTIERMQYSKVGFYVGQLFLMDNLQYLMFLLENGSLLLLFVTVITR